MIILDEAHRIPAKILSEIQDLSDHLEIAVVLVGTDRLNTLLEQDDQVDLRFCHTYHFSCLNADELREMTALWEEHVLQLPKPIKPHYSQGTKYVVSGNQRLYWLVGSNSL